MTDDRARTAAEATRLADPLGWDAPEPKYSDAKTFTRCRECEKLFGWKEPEDAIRLYRRHYFLCHMNQNWSA